jgi:cupin fold WbuC family metalloprotein
MSHKAKVYGTQDYASLEKAAGQSPRKRMNLNIHSDYSDPCQRLFISMQPRSYVVPHRHNSPAKAETFIVLRGCIGIVFFDDCGKVVDSISLGPEHESQVCDIPPGTWHTAISLDAKSIFMEIKAGPFSPIDPADVAPWAPSNSTDDVELYLDQLYLHFSKTNQPFA